MDDSPTAIPRAPQVARRRGSNPRPVRALPFLTIVGLCAFWGAATVGSFATTGYHPLDDVISEISAHGANRAGLMVGGYLLLAIATAALARSLRPNVQAVGGDAAIPRLLAYAAIGAVGAGVFRCDYGCPTLLSGTLSNFLHGVFSMLFFLTVLIAMVRTARGLRSTTTEIGLRIATVVALVIAVPLMIATGLRVPDGEFVGLTQRLFLLAQTGWMGLIALRLA